MSLQLLMELILVMLFWKLRLVTLSLQLLIIIITFPAVVTTYD